MATVGRWEDSLSYLTDEEVSKIYNALNVLKDWELFEKEYSCMPLLRIIVGAEDTARVLLKLHKAL